ncbi:hypothetical protein P43SY_002986 [Pythium insidiosum]|uniref:Purple acid phosphatase N-terminal domain-containing protein n=1 Tax=Pythium insidiosum TaxID=114742 RepID=A0AAD5LVX7_PYTIN|nr:hypothetical protein P43SY_002986 [Pythium insidiosum]
MPTLQLSSQGRPLQHLDMLNVSFASASPGDWLGVYCLEMEAADADASSSPSQSPAPSRVAVGDYLDYRALGDVPHGVASFGPLVNMRCRLEFRLVSAQNEVRAVSPVVAFAQGPTQPTQRHLALTARAGEMRVHWVSANVSRPVVRYGRRRDELSLSSLAQRRTYDASDMCHAPATTRGPRLFRDPGVLFDAVMTGLQSGETYFYQVGSGNDDADGNGDGVWSEVESFRMPPAAGEGPSTPANGTTTGTATGTKTQSETQSKTQSKTQSFFV